MRLEPRGDCLPVSHYTSSASRYTAARWATFNNDFQIVRPSSLRGSAESGADGQENGSRSFIGGTAASAVVPLRSADPGGRPFASDICLQRILDKAEFPSRGTLCVASPGEAPVSSNGRPDHSPISFTKRMNLGSLRSGSKLGSTFIQTILSSRAAKQRSSRSMASFFLPISE